MPFELIGRIPGRPGVSRVRVAGGVVERVEPAAGDAADLIVPGLVDLQVNGWAGLDVNAADVDADTIERLVREQWRLGVTRLCPTVITGPPQRIERALAAIERARARDPLLAHAIPGAHLEGPLLAPQDGPRGAHDPDLVAAADAAEVGRLVAGGRVRVLTLAPERLGALDLVAAASSAGVLVAIGHTAASPALIDAAVAAGARLSTHLGNGAHPVLPRHPNYIWAQLARDELAASFIADGHHLDAATFTAMVRAKGPGRALLVSDSVALGGQPPGQYRTPVGGQVVLEPDGRLRLAGSTLLAGAARSLLDGLAWAVETARVPLADAVRMAGAVPAGLLGLDGHADVEPGRTTDLAVLRPGPDGWRAVATVVAGRLVHGA
ncbi:N-acetylglucosamine-6-phosphate deacetylase [Dactylosporangium salmoneum]|uniref:N-acetylglucosamine-6-phosphate deacetylase n=1 Tax=Dactylosporangium salmoneum TaxID=53361 RepID=UPI0031CEDA0C